MFLENYHDIIDLFSVCLFYHCKQTFGSKKRFTKTYKRTLPFLKLNF